MGYYRQFDYFDPLEGHFSYWGYPQGHSAISRARFILRGRSTKQIKAIAEDADQMITSYFDSEKDYVIQKIKEDGKYELLEMNEDCITGFKDEASDHYDIRNSDNTSDLEALQEAMGQFFNPSVFDDIENLSESEYFATLTLWQIGNFVERTETVFDLSQFKRVKRKDKKLDLADTVYAARCLIDAMEAICYAERLREIERVQKKYEQQIQKIQSTRQLITQEDQARIRTEARQEFEAEAKARRVAQAKENGKLAHKESYEAKDLVLHLWEKNTTQFRSAEKAGAHYVDVLSKRGIEREHRTVVSWIRGRAKELGIRFR